MKKFGSPNWTRTSDPLINSQLLYQLSYRGIPVGTGAIAKGFEQIHRIFGSKERFLWEVRGHCFFSTK